MGLGTQLKLCPRLRFGRGLGEVPPMGTQLKLCPQLRFGRGFGGIPQKVFLEFFLQKKPHLAVWFNRSEYVPTI